MGTFRDLRLSLAGTTLSALIALACAPTPPPAAPAPAAPAPAAPPAAPKAPQPKSGGVLHYLAQAPAQSPYIVKTGNIFDYFAYSPVFENLLRYDYQFDDEGKVQDWRKQLKVVPNLAESWQQVDDTTLLFKIRRGIKWHDGAPFAAEDVAFTFSQLRDPKVASPQAWTIAAIDTFQVVDPLTLRVTLKAPDPEFLPQMALVSNGVWIYPKHVFDRGDDLAKVAIGTGPYKVRSYDPNSLGLFERFDDYWQGRPLLDGVKIVNGTDRSAQTAGILAGENDFMNMRDRREFEPVQRTRPDIKSLAFAADLGNAVLFNMKKPPFNDIRVRQAWNLAVDRQAMMTALTVGEGVVNPPAVPGSLAQLALPPEELNRLPGYRQPKDQDSAEAKRLLQAAGYGDGLKLTLLVPGTNASSPPISEAMAGQLRVVGFDITLNNADRARFNKEFLEGSFDAAVNTAGNVLNGTRASSYFHTKGTNNASGIGDSHLDGLLERQARTLDANERRKIWHDIQRYILEKAYGVGTIEFAHIAIWQPWVHNFVANLSATAYMYYPPTAWIDIEAAPKGRSLK